MDDATKAEIQAMIDASVSAAIKNTPLDPSQYVTHADLATALEGVHSSVADTLANSAGTAVGDLEHIAETKRVGVWLNRVLSKFHSAERPSDTDIGVVRDEKTGSVTSVEPEPAN